MLSFYFWLQILILITNFNFQIKNTYRLVFKYNFVCKRKGEIVEERTASTTMFSFFIKSMIKAVWQYLMVTIQIYTCYIYIRTTCTLWYFRVNPGVGILQITVSFFCISIYLYLISFFFISACNKKYISLQSSKINKIK